MANCCSPRLYGKVFGERMARRDAARYRKRGLRRSARDVVEAAAGRAQTVLEIGGGVGDIGLELLARGASHATNVELSPSYERPALELARERGVEERIAYRVGDIAQGTDVEPADAVILHRVVCCYPDGTGLVAAAASQTRQMLLVTLPREVAWTRAGFALFNFVLWAFRLKFRTFVHPHREIVAAAERAGLRRTSERRRLVWHLLAFEA